MPAQKILLLILLAAGPSFPQGGDGFTLYNGNCSSCHGPEGDLVQGVDIRSGQFRRAANDNDLARIITRGIPGTPMPPASLTPPQVSAIIAYLRSPRSAPERPAKTGDAARGLAIFEGKGGCLQCHRVGGKGSRLGPDLSDIGAMRPVAELERSILEPGAVVLPQNRFVRAVTTAGATITGRRLNEDTLTVQLIDSTERLLSLSKDTLREYVILDTSSMPSYKGKLSPQELSDLVGYLLSLKGSTR